MRESPEDSKANAAEHEEGTGNITRSELYKVLFLLETKSIKKKRQKYFWFTHVLLVHVYSLTNKNASFFLTISLIFDNIGFNSYKM